MLNKTFRISTTSGVSPIEAGFGLVHADTIVATTQDELIAAPSTMRVELKVNGRLTSGPVVKLGLAAGMHEGDLRVLDGTSVLAGKTVGLLLVEPERVCRRFGARYGSLEYELPVVIGKNKTAPWASLWKTNEVADIVVDFNAPYKFILWRGMSFAPSWAMDNVLTSNFFAETVEPGVYRDCCEMMSDRECRYSHARIIHSSDARVVIYWRYALNDSAYTICRNQWADEMFYIYPDGVAVRNVTIYLDPRDDAVWQVCSPGRRVPYSMINGPAGKRTFNDMEFITVNAPGATSDDNTPLEALTLMDGDKFSRTYQWPKPPDFNKEPLPNLSEYIFKMNYHHRPSVFVASPSAGLQVRLQDNTGMCYDAGKLVQDDRWVSIPDLPTNFADYIHWPVTRGYGTTPLTDRAMYQERPTHTFLGFANNAPVAVLENGAVTWSWLCGIAPENDLRARVRTWTAPTAIDGTSYDSKQGAYVVSKWKKETVLKVGRDHAVVRPTFMLPGCESAGIRVSVNGTRLDKGSVGVGIERTVSSVKTVITFAEDILPGSEVLIRTNEND